MTIAVVLRAVHDPELAHGVTHATVRLDEPSAMAVGLALQLRSRLPGAPLAALAVGPGDWDVVLREVLALGVDTVRRVWDGSLAEGDAVDTARALAQGLPPETRFVVAGGPASDHGSGIVATAMAEMLGWPCLANVAATEADMDGLVARVRAGGGRRQRYRLNPPAVIVAANQPPPPLFPPLPRRLRARKALVPTLPFDGGNGGRLIMVGTGPAWPRRRQLIQPSASANPAQRLRQLMSGGMGGGQGASVDAARAAETLADWLTERHFVVETKEDRPG